MEAGWSNWKETFLESFADRGWSTGIYAISYRHKEGSFMEYTMRKEKLLLDMDNNIGTKTLVMLIAAGLPALVRDKIDRENCENLIRLLHEIRKCESQERQDIKKKFEEKKPCINCEKLNRGTRYHPEDSCWFKKKNGNETRVITSNSVLEVDLNTEQKNE